MPKKTSTTGSSTPVVKNPKPKAPKKVKPGKVSLIQQKALIHGGLTPPRRSARTPVPRKQFGMVTKQEKLEALDLQVGVMDPGLDQDDLEDQDYMQVVPGRPTQFNHTFATVYGTVSAAINGYFETQCAEPRCLAKTRTITMNGKWQDVSMTFIPPRRLTKPPVCHITSWAALEIAMLDHERVANRKFTEHFRRSVCWDPGNLQPGHAVCNGAGLKTNAQTAGSERAQADIVIRRVTRIFTSLKMPIWEN